MKTLNTATPQEWDTAVAAVSKLTEWFPKEMPPVHPGPYQTEVHFIEGDFSYFDGEKWFCSADSPDQALCFYQEGLVSGCKSKVWRGLRSPS
jgi:hypothetical protein